MPKYKRMIIKANKSELESRLECFTSDHGQLEAKVTGLESDKVIIYVKILIQLKEFSKSEIFTISIN